MPIHLRPSGFIPEDNICWQFNNPGDRERRCQCPACSHGERALAFFGRCRSGRRWFWSAHTLFTDINHAACSFTDTEDAAIQAAMAAVCRFRLAVPVLARINHGFTSRHLKEINAEKRRARPAPNTTDSRAIEYLHSGGRDDEYYHKLVLHRFRISKRTPKRFFYVRRGKWPAEHGEPINLGHIRNLDD